MAASTTAKPPTTLKRSPIIAREHRAETLSRRRLCRRSLYIRATISTSYPPPAASPSSSKDADHSAPGLAGSADDRAGLVFFAPQRPPPCVALPVRQKPVDPPSPTPPSHETKPSARR